MKESFVPDLRFSGESCRTLSLGIDETNTGSLNGYSVLLLQKENGRKDSDPKTLSGVTSTVP